MCMVHAMKDVVNTYMVTCVPGMYPMSTYDTWIGALNITAEVFRLLLKLEAVSMLARNPVPQCFSMGGGKCLKSSPSQSLEHGHHIPQRRSKHDIT